MIELPLEAKVEIMELITAADKPLVFSPEGAELVMGAVFPRVFGSSRVASMRMTRRVGTGLSLLGPRGMLWSVVLLGRAALRWWLLGVLLRSLVLLDVLLRSLRFRSAGLGSVRILWLHSKWQGGGMFDVLSDAGFEFLVGQVCSWFRVLF